MKNNKTLFFAVPLMIVLIFIAVYKYGYVGVRADLASIKEEEAVKSKLLGKYLALIAEKPGTEEQLVSLKSERKSDDSKLIEGQTISLASAALQEIIKTIITEKKGTISSERVGKPEDLGKFKIVNVGIDALVPDTAALSDILYSIETRTPYLVIKELDIRVRNPLSRAPKDLMVKMDISALTGAK